MIKTLILTEYLMHESYCVFSVKDLLKVGSTGDFLIQPNNIFTEQEKMCV